MNQTVTPKPSSTPHVGLQCRRCGCRHFHTVYTRRRNDGIIRRKRCRHCGQAITTRERVIGCSMEERFKMTGDSD